MAKSSAVDPANVVWLAPETLGQQELAEKLADASSPEEALDLLNSRPRTGQYRENLGHEVADGPEGTTVLAPKLGDLLVWVDEAPDDPEDGSGHFERYSGDEENYAPTRRED